MLTVLIWQHSLIIGPPAYRCRDLSIYVDGQASESKLSSRARQLDAPPAQPQLFQLRLRGDQWCCLTTMPSRVRLTHAPSPRRYYLPGGRAMALTEGMPSTRGTTINIGGDSGDDAAAVQIN